MSLTRFGNFAIDETLMDYILDARDCFRVSPLATPSSGQDVFIDCSKDLPGDFVAIVLKDGRYLAFTSEVAVKAIRRYVELLSSYEPDVAD